MTSDAFSIPLGLLSLWARPHATAYPAGETRESLPALSIFCLSRFERSYCDRGKTSIYFNHIMLISAAIASLSALQGQQ